MHAHAGVSLVSLEGADKDQIVVIGEGVDSVCLAMALRKKSYHAEIMNVEEVKDKDKEKEESKPEESEPQDPLPPLPLPCGYGHYPPCPPCVVYDPYGSNCIIL